MDFKQEIFRSMQNMINKAIINCKVDRTYKSIIKEITSKGYVVLDNTGCERTVRCCIPGTNLKIGQSVWVKEPMGRLVDLHICGVVEK